MPTAYHPSNAEWVRPIESLTSDGVRELQRLQAENAELRELMADMLRYYAMPNGIDYKREADLLERAHEMGVDA